MRMYDLTDLTGMRAERARSTFLASFQIPAAWVAPITVGVITGAVLGIAAWPLTGPAAILPAVLLTPLVAIWLTVDDVEAPWRRAVRRARNHDGQFTANGDVLDLQPRKFIHVVPSCTPVTNRGENKKRHLR
ncbi:hypothetical protein GZ998_05565 [Actinomyces sp. 594]|uniref:hypothetical protein n=1 Tax=Actinomyces sp. 594 TaxID=2057793 RepID=UPI001C560A1B|nr:hypothetical protein [Actinomyces sp. 594]MBW3068981.1 hypothetical protein [Actinomyces sp. 594]